MDLQRGLGAAIGVLLIAGVGGAIWRDDEGRAADVARRRALYDQIEVLPGSRLLDEHVQEIVDDNGPVGAWQVVRVYEVPVEVTAAEVMAHFHSVVPPGWRAADDRECFALTDPPIPTDQAEAESEHFGLMLATSRMTMVTSADPGRAEWVGIGVDTVLGERRLIIGEGEISCGPPDDRDRYALEFDALGVREGDPLGLRLEALPYLNCQLLAASFGDGEGRRRVQLQPGVDVPCAAGPEAVRVEDLDGDGDLDVAMVDQTPMSPEGMVLGRWIQAPDGSFARSDRCEVRLATGDPPHLAPC